MWQDRPTSNVKTVWSCIMWQGLMPVFVVEQQRRHRFVSPPPPLLVLQKVSGAAAVKENAGVKRWMFVALYALPALSPCFLFHSGLSFKWSYFVIFICNLRSQGLTQSDSWIFFFFRWHIYASNDATRSGDCWVVLSHTVNFVLCEISYVNED